MSMNERETHAAVVAEMRECDGWRAYHDGGLHHDSHEADVVDVDYLHDFANRADAAHRREIDALAAKLDEAKRESRLKYITDGLVCMHDAKLGAFASAVDAAAMREALDIALDALIDWSLGQATRDKHCVAVKAIKAALAAPPRNCDMPLVVDGTADNNADKAWRVFKKHNPNACFGVPGLLRCIDWLFAPANEEGETYGKGK